MDATEAVHEKNETLTFKVIIDQGNTNAPYHTNI